MEKNTRTMLFLSAIIILIFYNIRDSFGERILQRYIGACQKGFPTSFTELPKKRGLCIRGYIAGYAEKLACITAYK